MMANEERPSGANHVKFHSGRGLEKSEEKMVANHSKISIIFQKRGTNVLNSNHVVVHFPDVEKLA